MPRAAPKLPQRRGMKFCLGAGWDKIQRSTGAQNSAQGQACDKNSQGGPPFPTTLALALALSRTNTGTNPPRPKPPKTAGAPAALMINGCTTLDIDVHVGVSWLFGSQGITAST